MAHHTTVLSNPLREGVQRHLFCLIEKTTVIHAVAEGTRDQPSFQSRGESRTAAAVVREDRLNPAARTVPAMRSLRYLVPVDNPCEFDKELAPSPATGLPLPED